MRVRDRSDVLIDLMLGALHADGEFTDVEDGAFRTLLHDLLCTRGEPLPAAVEARIAAFDPGSFDVPGAARDFLTDPPMKKRRLLELVGRLVLSDGVLDMAEDDYMRSLAAALEMEPEEYEDLVLDYEIEELRESFNALRLPPPVPT
jgi:uncharacterized tellurite resistance protein B-like protein